jgi:hypothetical protein
MNLFFNKITFQKEIMFEQTNKILNFIFPLKSRIEADL